MTLKQFTNKMSFEIFLELIKYLWVPLLGFAYKTYNVAQEKQDKRIDTLEKKVSYQMTKEDVNEIVHNATRLLTAEIKLELQKIDNGVHQIKNQGFGKDATLIELNHTLSEIHNFIRRNDNK